jgi:hypothetical protein
LTLRDLLSKYGYERHVALIDSILEELRGGSSAAAAELAARELWWKDGSLMDVDILATAALNGRSALEDTLRYNDALLRLARTFDEMRLSNDATQRAGNILQQWKKDEAFQRLYERYYAS